MRAFLNFSENLISGMLPFVLLIICGIYFTVKCRFFQFRFLPESLKYALGGMRKGSRTDGVSPFQAACTALSATVGTGNIAGVAGAVAIGGAGAVFWMWISAFAGMTVKVAEILLSLEYREKKNGEYVGGPMYYIKNGLPKLFAPLAVLYSAAAVPAVFCSGNFTQTNSAVLSIGGSGIIRLAGGIFFAMLTLIVLAGGAQRVAGFTCKTVPFMAVLYLLMTFGIIFVNFDRLPNALSMIFKGAFDPSAVTGGAVGSAAAAVFTGASRGVFSNEAGLGTSAMAHSASSHTDGMQQGLFGIFEVFADTVVICTLTALSLLCSGVGIEYGKGASAELVSFAFATLYGKYAVILLAVMMCLFGLSSVIGWGYYGIVSCDYLFGKTGRRLFIILYPLACIPGALINADTAWRLSGIFNGIMLCINAAAVLLLSENAINSMNGCRRKGLNAAASSEKRIENIP